MSKSFRVGFSVVLLLSVTSLALAATGDTRLADAVMRADRDAVRSLLHARSHANVQPASGHCWTSSVCTGTASATVRVNWKSS